jgi:hypothetical protein
MEKSQGNSLCSYMYLKLAKTAFKKKSFLFSLLKNQWNRSCVGRRVSTNGREEMKGKESRRVNIVQKIV